MKIPKKTKRVKTYSLTAKGQKAKPGRGHAAASVRMPVVIQAVISPPGLPVIREISADTMKMPEPTIAPAAAIVQSKSPRLRANLMFSRPPVTCNGSPDRSACVLLRLFDEGPGFMRSGLPVHQGILIRGAM
jgi:hypothetical protein